MTIYGSKLKNQLESLSFLSLFPLKVGIPYLKVFINKDEGVSVIPPRKDEIVLMGLLQCISWYKL